MKLYHLSDLHLGAVPSGRSAGEHINLVLTKLKEILSRAEDVPVVLFAGDTFDSNAVSSSVAREFFNLLSNFPAINFVLIPGGGHKNESEISGHDAYTADSIYRRPEISAFFRKENIHLLSPETPSKVISVSDKKLAIYAGFFDFPEEEIIPEADYHIALLHGAFGSNEQYEKPLKSNLLERYHYLALGHYHRFKKLAENAFYAGAFIPFEFLANTQAEGGFLEVDLSAKPPQILRHTFDDAPLYLRLQIHSEEDLERLKNLDFTKAFVRIDSYLEFYEDELSRLCSHFEEKITISEGARLNSPDDLVLQIINELLQSVPEEIQAEVREFLLYGLMVSRQPRELKEFLIKRFLES
ncbi:metallophosphoesterase family protein [Thermodesulfatator autotrophicus]|uniref:Calcineurin-like phosphoesterase domain-containing protein n=1 Tax=Thermodesulfatator autotrophicus TaxID=1795632 RepID=A0A177E8H2_9BACT|nr:metallophosphoesterase [Thermodesulfatator autotrophicus]OAG28205.1 hypothetical protein TH606_02850 [Thermodesulfatator autotrophicus]